MNSSTSPTAAVVEFGLKVRPLSPTAMLMVAADADEARSAVAATNEKSERISDCEEMTRITDFRLSICSKG